MYASGGLSGNKLPGLDAAIGTRAVRRYDPAVRHLAFTSLTALAILVTGASGCGGSDGPPELGRVFRRPAVFGRQLQRRRSAAGGAA